MNIVRPKQGRACETIGMSRAVFAEVEEFAPFFAWLDHLSELTFREIYKEQYEFGIGQHLWRRYLSMDKNIASFLSTIDCEHQNRLLLKYYGKIPNPNWWHVMHFFHGFRNGISVSWIKTYNLNEKTYNNFVQLNRCVGLTYASLTLEERKNLIDAVNMYNKDSWNGKCANRCGMPYRCWSEKCESEHV